MSALHLIIPIFLAIEFVLVLIALVSAMLFAAPQSAVPARNACRCHNPSTHGP